MNNLFESNQTSFKTFNKINVITDTDSVYLTLQDVKKTFAKDISDSEFFQKIDQYCQDFFNKILEIKAKNENVPQMIRLKREGIILNQLVLANLCPVSLYNRMMKTLRYDVGIAPVKANLFNASKSNLKQLEYFYYEAFRYLKRKDFEHFDSIKSMMEVS